ncbi:battenin-like isoform X1 [Haliotis rufescens]|uniref:battenin-like isoform X1 n=1 Tax=Haliotis rufescens TaxID=6454 RepID=UPI00201E94FE|nr:battenin-like isoform X1 [Haliotis rufescens]
MVVERKSKYVLGPAVVEKIEVEEDNVADSPRQWRNLVGFWFLGLTNNFAYVVMLSAAHDILATEEEGGGNSTLVTTLAPENGTTPPSVNGSNNTDTFLECNKISTGAILLADILPTLVIKLTAPFYLQKIGYRVKVILVVAFALASFLLVALSKQIWLSILGVVCASISGGLGEITYLSLSTFFHCDVVSAWSSGTGGAGVFGALAYAGFTQVVSPRTTVLILTVVPVIMFIRSVQVCHQVSPSLSSGQSKSVIKSVRVCHHVHQVIPSLSSCSSGQSKSVIMFIRSVQVCHHVHQVSPSLSSGQSKSVIRSVQVCHRVHQVSPSLSSLSSGQSKSVIRSVQVCHHVHQVSPSLSSGQSKSVIMFIRSVQVCHQVSPSLSSRSSGQSKSVITFIRSVQVRHQVSPSLSSGHSKSVIMFISYFLVLKKPTPNDTPALETSTEQLITTQPVISLKGKAALVIPLLKYMIPLSLVYFAEYFINQGLHELLYFNNIWLSKSEQYRWYQVDYQIGVFISRSSVNCFEIRKLWILPILQFGNLAVLLTQIFYRYIPNIWIIIAIVFFEGLLGGGAYVNTFYRIRKEIAPEVREFSLGVATVGDAVGIAVAGAAAIPSHNRLCDLNLRM